MEIKSVSSFVDNPSGRVYIFEKESANFCFRCATFLHEKNNTFCNHSQTKFRYSAFALFCNFAEQILSKRLKKGVSDCTFLHIIVIFKKELITCLKIFFLHPDACGTLHIKMCTISHKSRAVFCQILILNLIKI